MKIVESIEEFKDPREPLVLTIGYFDGVHRGHCALIKKMKEIAGAEGQTVVITFRNHPSEVLRPEQPVLSIYTLPHKLHLLESLNIDQTILLNFTSYLAQRNAATFIENLRKSIPFSHLVLGHDATLGRDKQGNRAAIMELGDLWGFTPHYLEEFRFEGKGVSSSRIREALQQGNLLEAETLLNRPYSIFAPVISQDGKTCDSDRIQLSAAKLCLPPPGSYPIEVHLNSKRIDGSAIINQSEILEVHLQDKIQLTNPMPLEIMFKVPDHHDQHSPQI